MYLSKQSLMCLFFQMRFLYSKERVQDQGGTQFFSELKYFMALDEFTKSQERPCNTNNRDDKQLFISNVGRIVKISDPNEAESCDTKNFFDAFKSNDDFDVSSNFFSAGSVNLSRNTNDPVPYPKRHPQLMECSSGIISIVNEAYDRFATEKTYFNGDISKFALLFIWLNRHTNVSDTANAYEVFLENLREIYSDNLLRNFRWEDDPVRLKINDILAHLDYNENATYLNPRELVIDYLNHDFVKKIFSCYLEIKSRSTNPNYKSHCVDICESWLNEALPNNDIGNLFRHRDPAKFEQEFDRIINLENFDRINRNDGNGKPIAALNLYCDFLKYMPHDRFMDLLSNLRIELINHPEKKNDVRNLLSEISDTQPTPQDLLFTQIIYFGAPGTGKSNKIEKNIFVDANGAQLNTGLSTISEEYKFRTTFHPDYDYAQFVGAYKPRAIQVVYQHENDAAEGAQNIANQNKTEITYEFTPQVFAKAYIKAWVEYIKAVIRDPNAVGEKVYLIIEEINRGNCAQIFGDIFQLLDRKNRHSAYSIDVDTDFAEYIKKKLVEEAVIDENDVESNCWDLYKAKIQEWNRNNNDEQFVIADGAENFCKVALPPNMIILATMNTSDQSLFPMDSAFKRRFDWEYVPIDDSLPDANFDIFIDETYSRSWLTFLKKVNENISTVTHSEDKQMGEFFIKPKDNSNNIKFEEFRSKVLFYLWDTIYKDEMDNDDAGVFRLKNGNNVEKITFQKLFEGGSAQLDRQKELVKRIIDGVIDEQQTQQDEGGVGGNRE